MKREDYEFYFSKERIESYDNIEQHNKNLKLISKISMQLGIFELFFRNRINHIFQDITKNDEWLVSLRDRLNELGKNKTKTEEQLYRAIKRVDKKECKTHPQIISSLSFGVWVNLAKLLMLDWRKFGVSYIEILDVSSINLRKYDANNHLVYDNNLKLIIIIRLIQHIRNRAFHWENLLKTKQYGNKGKLYSNISVNEGEKRMWILPKNIEIFLIDVVCCIDEKINEDIENSQLVY